MRRGGAVTRVSGRVTEPRLVSSRVTFWMKFVFPPLWIAGFGAGTVGVWLSDGQPRGPPAAMFLGFWLVGTALIWWSCARLKRVRVDETHLYVSNYRTEVSIPLANVRRVSESRWDRGRPVTVEFRTPTPFGQRIVFLPKARWVGWFESHPVVAELRELSARAGGPAAS